MRKRSTALTMMEVMVAVAILSIALLALVSIISFAFKVQSKSEKAHAASLVAKSLLNETGHLLDANFDMTELSPPLPGPDQVEHPPGSGFLVSLEMVPEGLNLKRVTVTVSWEDSNGRQAEKTTTKFLRENR